MRTVLWPVFGLLFVSACSGSSLSAEIEPGAVTPVQADSPDTTLAEPTPESPAPAADSPAEPPAEEVPETPEPPAALDCGPNASDVSGTCTCEAQYSICDAADVSIGCCAYGVDTFDITMVSALVVPFEDPIDETPWDWSGFIPGWLRDLIGNVVVAFDDDAAAWVDLLDYLLDFAPELLEGTTPPDPFIDVEIGEDSVYETSAVDDSIEPVWNETETFTVGAEDEMVLWFRDEDLGFDDTIAGVGFTQEHLQWFAGLGELTFEGSNGLHSFTLVIEPL